LGLDQTLTAPPLVTAHPLPTVCRLWSKVILKLPSSSPVEAVIQTVQTFYDHKQNSVLALRSPFLPMQKFWMLTQYCSGTEAAVRHLGGVYSSGISCCSHSAINSDDTSVNICSHSQGMSSCTDAQQSIQFNSFCSIQYHNNKCIKSRIRSRLHCLLKWLLPYLTSYLTIQGRQP